MHPFRELPKPNNVERVETAGVVVSVSPWPTAQIVQFAAPDVDVPAAVAAAREVARRHGKSTLGWWVAPEFDRYAAALEAEGLANADTPGFEAVENAMVLVGPPPGGGGEAVEVSVVDSFGDYVASSRLASAVFGAPQTPLGELRQRYRELLEAPSQRAIVAKIDGRVVGASFAALGPAGVNLFGGSVDAGARGRGVYRAMVGARWQLAVERGTPALTVQAGRMSMPILERLGFVLVERIRVFVDELGA